MIQKSSNIWYLVWKKKANGKEQLRLEMRLLVQVEQILLQSLWDLELDSGDFVKQ